MQINSRRSQRIVTKQLLNLFDVNAALQEPNGVCVPQHVAVQVLAQLGDPAETRDAPAQCSPAEPLACGAGEYRAGLTFNPLAQSLDQLRRHGDVSVLEALSLKDEKLTPAEIKVPDVQVANLRDAQPAVKADMDGDLVTAGSAVLARNLRVQDFGRCGDDKPLPIFGSEKVRELAAALALRRINSIRHVQANCGRHGRGLQISNGQDGQPCRNVTSGVSASGIMGDPSMARM